MVNMTRAGEVGGFLDAVLLQIAENFEAEVKLRGKIKSAMTYPVVVFVIAILAVDRHAAVHRAGLREHVRRPRRHAAAADPDPGVPLERRCSLLAPLGRGARRSSASSPGAKSGTSEQVRNVVDPLKLKVPVFGKLFQKVALSRFARNLGTMLSSGVPILQSLEIVGETTGNVVLAPAPSRMSGAACAAASPSPARWRSTTVFPPMVVQMIAVGEDTGAIDTMLQKISDFYDEEVEATTEALTAPDRAADDRLPGRASSGR